MSNLLKETLEKWREIHPGGAHTFGVIEPSNKRQTVPIRALTRHEAQDNLRAVLDNSKWNVVKGWHCLRHSFISNLASSSVDQRLIDEFVGHTTEGMRRRYRHLFPDVKQAAISSVFD